MFVFFVVGRPKNSSEIIWKVKHDIHVVTVCVHSGPMGRQRPVQCFLVCFVRWPVGPLLDS